MTPPGIEAFDDIEDLTERTLATLGTDLNKAQGEILEDIITLTLTTLAISKAGKFINKVENFDNLRKLRRLVDELLKNHPTLKAAFAKYLEAFPKTTILINGYFSQMGAKPGAYEEMTKFLIQKTADDMLDYGINGEFRKGIIDTLTTHVTEGAPIAKLRTSLAATVEAKPLERYAGQVADDALNQYSRQYTQAVTDDLGLEYYFYKGTKIETSRPFCVSRTGKYFTQAEVESWANLDYAGKIPGTDKDTIYTYLGGYRCKHRLVPVSKAVYEARK